MDVLQNIGVFLISVVFSLYIGAVLIRFLLALSRANFHNPLSQFIVKVTNPVLVPLRRFIPAIGKLDTSAIVLALGLKIVSVMLLASLGVPLLGGNAVFVAMAELLRAVVWIYIIVLLIQAVMSWMGNSYNNPMAGVLESLTAPILRPLRQFIPTIGMVDLSPLVAILLLNIVLIVLAPLPRLGF